MGVILEALLRKMFGVKFFDKIVLSNVPFFSRPYNLGSQINGNGVIILDVSCFVHYKFFTILKFQPWKSFDDFPVNDSSPMNKKISDLS